MGDIWCLIILCIVSCYQVVAWENEDFELFDLVEEINKNFYEELGVSQDATSAEIRKAYRRISLQLHPDKNKAEGAEVQFRQLVSMYEVLKDKTRRERYDHILQFGLPDWRQPVYYYRKVRKLGLLEISGILFVIFTVGHFIVIWAAYFEKRFELEEVFKSRKKKDKKGKKMKGNDIQEQHLEELQHHLSTVPRPLITDLLPIKCLKGLRDLLILAVTSAPLLVTVIKQQIEEWKSKHQTNENINSEDEDDTPVKTVKRRKVVVPGELCKVEKPVSYLIENTTAAEATIVKSVKSGEWSHEEKKLLTKAITKFPGGTKNRWEKVADFVGRPVEEVIKYAKSFNMNTKDIAISSQGITGAEKNFLNKRNLEPSKIKETDSGFGESGESSSTQNDSSLGISSKTASLVANKNKLVLNQQDNDNNKQWSQNQQKIFEWGILHYPKGTQERWDKIAEHIPGKTKEDCMLRFKYLAEVVKKKKKEQQNPVPS